MQTDADRFTNHDMQYFSPKWEQRGDINHEVSDHEPTPKPENYELMLELSERLSRTSRTFVLTGTTSAESHTLVR